MPGVGDPRHRQSEQLGERPVADVVEVGRPLGEIATRGLEDATVLGDRAVDRVGRIALAGTSART